MCKSFTMASLCLLLGISWSINAKEMTIDQLDKTFMINGKLVETLKLNKNDVIHFKNMDPWFHNIFSLSELKTFDLGSFDKGKSKSVTFDKVGMMEIECAIHPQMFLEVEIK